MLHQLAIDYPDLFPDMLGRTPEQFECEAEWAMAIKLFEMKQLSPGMAAILIGMYRITFLLGLADYNAPLIDLSEAELISDLENV